MLLLRMLSLGQGAWDMIDSQVFKEPRLVCALRKRKSMQWINIGLVRIFCLTGLLCWCCQDKEVVTCFLPAMMSVVVDDNIFTVEQKLPSEEKSSQVYPTLLPDAFYRYSTRTFLFLQCLEESGWVMCYQHLTLTLTIPVTPY